MFGSPSTRHKVEPILTGTVKEVVLQVSHGGFVEVIEGALLCACSSPGEVGLEGASSAICLRDSICMIGPDYVNGFE